MPDACVLEIALEDGTWEKVGARAAPGAGYLRWAQHEWEEIPPHYGRCRWCGAVVDHNSRDAT